MNAERQKPIDFAAERLCLAFPALQPAESDLNAPARGRRGLKYLLQRLEGPRTRSARLNGLSDLNRLHSSAFGERPSGINSTTTQVKMRPDLACYHLKVATHRQVSDRNNLVWDVLDPKEMGREGTFAEGAIKFGVSRDQGGGKRDCSSEIETVMDGAILAAGDFQR